MLDFRPRFDSWESQLTEKLLRTANLRFLWTMQETSGTAVSDLSNNSRTGTYDGVTLNQFAPNRRVNKTVKLDAANDLITAVAGCSVRSLAAITLVAVLNIKTAADLRCIWFESTADNVASARNFWQIAAAGALVWAGRSGLAAQTISTRTSDPLSVGYHICHTTVDIASDTVAHYSDGVVVASTGTIDFGTDTIFVDTAPAAGPQFGKYSAGTPRWFDSNAAYFGMFARVLTTDEILAHAKAGGFA